MGLFEPLPPGSSPPWSRKKIVTVVAVYAVAIGFGVSLFTGSIPGLGGNLDAHVMLDGHAYYSDFYWLGFPSIGNNSTPPASLVFHNVTFWIWLTGWGLPQGSLVHGNGTELNGTSYSFQLGGLPSNPSRTDLFVSPDAKFATAWSGQLFLEVLVEV